MKSSIAQNVALPCLSSERETFILGGEPFHDRLGTQSRQE
jgi:hypothetical protein